MMSPFVAVLLLLVSPLPEPLPYGRSVANDARSEPSEAMPTDQSQRRTIGKRLRTASLSRPTDAAQAPASVRVPRVDTLVFGIDDRIRVSDTTLFPHSAITYVESTFPNGEVLPFTGLLASPYAVVTSASALYDPSLGGFAERVIVAPGQTQLVAGGPILRPYGSREAARLEVPAQWVDVQDVTAIHGAIFLDEPFDQISSYPPLRFDATPSGAVAMAGYDLFAQGEGDSYAQWLRAGAFAALGDVFVEHHMDDDGGAVGAPIWESADESAGVVAINCCVTSAETANVALRLTGQNADDLNSWVRFTPHSGAPLLLNGGRFRITVEWTTQQENAGAGVPVHLTPDTGIFWFFNQANVELIVKVLDGCNANGHFWVFAAGLTNVEARLIVEDQQTGTIRSYSNPLAVPFAPIQDTNAFATCP
jgi:V8-like Glu-specific endopeptidase